MSYQQHLIRNVTLGFMPGAPTSVSAVPGDGAATVSWATPPAGSGSPVTSYTVTSMPGGQTCTWTSGPLKCTVSGITNATSYTFTVVATNANGHSPTSVSSAAILVGAPGVPTVVTAVPGDTSMTVRWAAPPPNASPLTGYTVTVYFLGVAKRTLAVTAPATSAVVTGLTNGYNYAFRVQAANAIGNGPLSAATVAVKVGTPTAPAFPTATAGNGQVTIRWWPSSSVASPLLGYLVTPYIGAVAQPGRTFNSTASTQVITGLTNGATYTFKVSGFNAIGTGPATTFAALIVGAPTPPAGVTAVTGVGQATVSWIAPADNGSAITGYVVTPYLGLVAQAPMTFASAAVSQIITGLTPGTYTFKVAAVNVRGTGNRSTTSNTVAVT
jgi:hypothetical protein